jgi:hypothetical protein
MCNPNSIGHITDLPSTGNSPLFTNISSLYTKDSDMTTHQVSYPNQDSPMKGQVPPAPWDLPVGDSHEEVAQSRKRRLVLSVHLPEVDLELRKVEDGLMQYQPT